MSLVLFALGVVLLLGFRVNDGSLLGGGFTLANFMNALSDPLYATVMLRSLVIAGLVTLATVVTRLSRRLLSCLLTPAPNRGLLLFLVTLPFWTSYLLRVFAWKIVLAYNGVLNSALMTSGITSEPILAFLNTPAAVVVTLAHAYAAFAILPIYVALETIPRSLLEAAVRSRRAAVHRVSAASCCRFRCRACWPRRSSSSCRRSATMSRRRWSAARPAR